MRTRWLDCCSWSCDAERAQPVAHLRGIGGATPTVTLRTPPDHAAPRAPPVAHSLWCGVLCRTYGASVTTWRRVVALVVAVEVVAIMWLALGVFFTPTETKPTNTSMALVLLTVTAPLIWFVATTWGSQRTARTMECIAVCGANGALVALSCSGLLGLDTAPWALTNALLTLVAAVVSLAACVVLLVDSGERSSRAV
jgi:hypothetical protein